MQRKTVLTGVLAFVCSCCFSAVATAQPQAVPIPQPPDPLLQNLTIPSDAAAKGMWSPLNSWPIIAMHSAVTPDGRLATFGSPVGGDTIQALVFDIWNPLRGFVTQGHRTLMNAPDVDSFCSAANLLSTGDLLASGGNWMSPDQTYNKGTAVLRSVRNSVGPGAPM